MMTTFDDEPVPTGLLVRYHGSLTEMHSTYSIAAECDCDRCDEACEVWRMVYWSAPPRMRSSTMRIWHKRRYVLTETSGSNVLERVGNSSITTTTPLAGFCPVRTNLASSALTLRVLLRSPDPPCERPDER